MKTYVLSKKEVCDAIVWWIGVMKENMSFFPYIISDASENLKIPDTTVIHLKMIPKGSVESSHNI